MRLLPEARESGYANSFDGTPIFWERHGPALDDPKAKRPMAFCYGLVCSTNQWRLQLERYSKEHPCIIFDYRAHHKSGNPSDFAFLNISALAKDLFAVIDHLKIEIPMHIWGHSMGCNVVLEYALAYPQRCHSLVLCCGTPNSPFANMFGSTVPEVISHKLFDLLDRYPEPLYKVWHTFKSYPKLTHAISYIAGFNTDTSTREDISAYAEAVSGVESQTFFKLLEDMSRGNIKNILPKIVTPTVVIAGALDRVTPPSEQKALSRGIGGSEYVEIPAGSHNVQLDFGEYVGLKVEDFWRRRSLDK